MVRTRSRDVDTEHADCDQIGGGKTVDYLRGISPTIEAVKHRAGKGWLPVAADAKYRRRRATV